MLQKLAQPPPKWLFTWAQLKIGRPDRPDSLCLAMMRRGIRGVRALPRRDRWHMLQDWGVGISPKYREATGEIGEGLFNGLFNGF